MNADNFKVYDPNWRLQRIERILDSCFVDNQELFYVKWQGSEEHTWIELSNLVEGEQDLVSAYFQDILERMMNVNSNSNDSLAFLLGLERNEEQEIETGITSTTDDFIFNEDQNTLLDNHFNTNDDEVEQRIDFLVNYTNARFF